MAPEKNEVSLEPEIVQIDEEEKEEVGSGTKREWKQTWKDMPEFVQNKQEPFAKIIFRFATAEDLQEFSTLIGQKLTGKTKSAWYPEGLRGTNSNKRYFDVVS